VLFLLTEDDEALLIAALHKQQKGRLVLRRRRHCGSDILDGVYRLAVDFFDHVSGLQPATVSRAVGSDVRNHNALLVALELKATPYLWSEIGDGESPCFVGAKATARWLWHAVDPHTGRVLAYVVGTRKDATFLKLRALLTRLGITRYYTDKAGGYRRHFLPGQHTVGKLSMQKIERKHLTLRTRLKRLARKTLCFSRSCLMHDLIIGLYMNQVEFGCAV